MPNPIYGAGGSAQVPLLQQVGKQLSGLPTPQTIVYYSAGGACAGYSALVNATPVTATANWWDSTGTQQTCTPDIAGYVPTFAVMGNGPTLCSGVTALAPGYGQFLGPVQSVDFVVPNQSSQQSISTEAAYYIWGFGAADAAHTVSPWNVPKEIFTRSATSYVALFVALDTGVPAATLGSATTFSQVATNQATITGLTSAATAENAIGFVSGEVADQNRSVIRVLAFQEKGQSCGYWPDSTKDAFDKINVRTSQYWLWSPVHLFAAVNQSGDITDAATANLVGYLTGDLPPPTGADIFGAEVSASTVPRCAMQAWRDGDLAAPYSYAPPAPCSCKFDLLATGSTSCTPCSGADGTHDAACTAAAPVCRNAYCEVN